MDAVTFTTEDGVRLEGELRMADGRPRGTAVICHPHPKHGGSKDHPILWAMRNGLAGAHGLAVLGFNFRGVMGSQGAHGGGYAEPEDLRAAIGRVRQVAPDLPTAVVGWSFGANVAARTSLTDPRVAALVLVGLPIRPKDLALPPLPSADERSAFARPVLVLCGSEDEYCPPEEARAFADGFARGRLTVLEGTDHFLGRREREAAAIVGDFVEEAFSS